MFYDPYLFSQHQYPLIPHTHQQFMEFYIYFLIQKIQMASFFYNPNNWLDFSWKQKLSFLTFTLILFYIFSVLYFFFIYFSQRKNKKNYKYQNLVKKWKKGIILLFTFFCKIYSKSLWNHPMLWISRANHFILLVNLTFFNFSDYKSANIERNAEQVVFILDN